MTSFVGYSLQALATNMNPDYEIALVMDLNRNYLAGYKNIGYLARLSFSFFADLYFFKVLS